MEDNPIFQFVSKHWSKLLLGLVVVSSGAIWYERHFRSNTQETSQDFFIAGQIYESFLKGEYLPVESIESAQNILKRHPELHPKYDVVLALTFFSQHNLEEGRLYARKLINHGRANLPEVYQDYAQTTLLISEEKYAEALTAATLLDQKIGQAQDCPALSAMNDLRILFLSQKVGNASLKKAYWEKLKNSPAYDSIASLFQEGNLSLEDYFGL